MKIRPFIASLALGWGFAGSALSQGFPSKPIKLVVPFAAGGPADVVAREQGLMLEAQGVDLVSSTADGLEAARKRDTAKWAQVIRDAKITVE